MSPEGGACTLVVLLIVARNGRCRREAVFSVGMIWTTRMQLLPVRTVVGLITSHIIIFVHGRKRTLVRSDSNIIVLTNSLPITSDSTR